MKTAICTLLVALALPAAAVAGGGKGHHPSHPTKATINATKNAAWMCKALRRQDPGAFAKAFGKNHNLRNAYGKCVSARAHSTKTHGAKLTFHNLVVNSTGTVTSSGPADCQSSTAGCTVTSAGSLDGVLGGTYTSTWTILWTQATSNGQGGYCAPATGTTTLSIAGIGTLTKSEQGNVCEVGATGSNVEHVLNGGTFTVSDGSGLLSSSSGSGTVSFDQKPGDTSAEGGAVTGSETFDTLSVTL
jgi:hypothetical protein